MELHKTTVVNLLYVLTLDQEPTRVPVMRDTLAMEKLAKVSTNSNTCSTQLLLTSISTTPQLFSLLRVHVCNFFYPQNPFLYTTLSV